MAPATVDRKSKSDACACVAASARAPRKVFSAMKRFKGLILGALVRK
jgi:hypothetical protein